jgi:hypothetical protein
MIRVVDYPLYDFVLLNWAGTVVSFFSLVPKHLGPVDDEVPEMPIENLLSGRTKDARPIDYERIHPLRAVDWHYFGPDEELGELRVDCDGLGGPRHNGKVRVPRQVHAVPRWPSGGNVRHEDMNAVVDSERVLIQKKKPPGLFNSVKLRFYLIYAVVDIENQVPPK